MGGRSSAATPSLARSVVQHVGIAAVLLVAVASIGAVVSARVVRDQTLRQPVAASELVAIQTIAPLVSQAVYDGDAPALRALDDRVRNRKAGTAIERVRVWSEDGVILYSDDPRLIGQSFPLDQDHSRALTSQGVASRVADLGRSDILLDRALGKSVEVSVGTRDTTGRPILVDTYYALDAIDGDSALTHRLRTVLLVSLLVVGLLCVPLAYSMARRMSRANGNDPT